MLEALALSLEPICSSEAVYFGLGCLIAGLISLFNFVYIVFFEGKASLTHFTGFPADENTQASKWNCFFLPCKERN